jgi:hypothetical protein
VDDDSYRTPGPVVAASAAAVGPLPFLCVYTILFLAHGLIYPVSPPDIGHSQADEALAGFAALILLVIGVLSIVLFYNRRTRIPFLIFQALVLGASIYFLLNSESGPGTVPALLLVTSLVALVAGLMPASAAHVRGPARPVTRRAKRARRAASPEAEPAGEIAAGPAGEPTGGGYVGRRRASEDGEQG